MMDKANVTDRYQESLDYLYGLINFELKRTARYMASKLDAARPAELMTALGDPHHHFPAVHIAGTKGKGSVAAMCANCLRLAGYRVGLYTSPHVREFRERIRILAPDDPDGRISEAEFVALMPAIRRAIESVKGVTWFEAITALAFLHFARKDVDVAVVEVGLGGRLDATNVLTPLVSVITSLSYDHTDLLGDTLDKIAWEKGGIIKPAAPVVTASQPPEALAKLREIALERETHLSIIGQNWQFQSGPLGGLAANQELIITRSPSQWVPANTSFSVALMGSHQLENAAVALAALDVIAPQFPALALDSVRNGLATVSWPGRLQVLTRAPESPTILLDCAHNRDSAIKLKGALENTFKFEHLRLILGATSGKDVAGMMAQLLPLAAQAIVTKSTHPRAMNPASLKETALQVGFPVDMAPTVGDALLRAWQGAGPDDLICVTGSIFVVGDLLNQWESLQSQLFYRDFPVKRMS